VHRHHKEKAGSNMSDENETDYAKIRFSGRKQDWPIWSTQFLALAQLKMFKKALLGKETPPDEEEDLDEDSSDAEIKKKLRARAANERAYSPSHVEKPSHFRLSIIQKQSTYQVAMQRWLGEVEGKIQA
jgi:hypothetical protein